MIDNIRSVVVSLLISIATFVSPVKQIAPTPPPKIGITITPKPTLTVIPTPIIAAVQASTQKCQFDREGFIKKARELGYSEEEINTYLSIHPGNCINITKNTQNNYFEPTRIPTKDYNYEFPTNKSIPTTESVIPIQVEGNVNCNQIGNFTSCSNGQTFNRIGNTTFDNKGNSFNQIGNTTFGSNGHSCTRIGTFVSCTYTSGVK